MALVGSVREKTIFSVLRRYFCQEIATHDSSRTSSIAAVFAVKRTLADARQLPAAEKEMVYGFLLPQPHQHDVGDIRAGILRRLAAAGRC